MSGDIVLALVLAVAIGMIFAIEKFGRRKAMKVILRLTRSQQMALVDIVIAYCQLSDEPQNFVDVSTDPATETTTGEILRLVSDVSELES